MAPAFDPPVPEEVVKATRARPLTGLMATACGARGNGVLPLGSAEGKVSRAVTLGVAGALRSTTASVAFALLATRARLRMLSTATETGPVATLQGVGEPKTVPSEPVQSDAVRTVSEGTARVPKSTTVMSLEP